MDNNSSDRCGDIPASDTNDVREKESKVSVEPNELRCYQCMKPVTYLFDDSRCKLCTRVGPDSV